MNFLPRISRNTVHSILAHSVREYKRESNTRDRNFFIIIAFDFLITLDDRRLIVKIWLLRAYVTLDHLIPRTADSGVQIPFAACLYENVIHTNEPPSHVPAYVCKFDPPFKFSTW